MLCLTVIPKMVARYSMELHIKIEWGYSLVKPLTIDLLIDYIDSQGKMT